MSGEPSPALLELMRIIARAAMRRGLPAKQPKGTKARQKPRGKPERDAT